MNHLPFPSNDDDSSDRQVPINDSPAPWKRAGPGEAPQIMFQVQLNNGTVISYAYCDLRETRLRDAGYLQLSILGMEKYHINIQGRNLTELANLIGMGKIKSFCELGPRTFHLPESSPAIDSITIETLTGPTY